MHLTLSVALHEKAIVSTSDLIIQEKDTDKPVKVPTFSLEGDIDSLKAQLVEIVDRLNHLQTKIFPKIEEITEKLKDDPVYFRHTVTGRVNTLEEWQADGYPVKKLLEDNLLVVVEKNEEDKWVEMEKIYFDEGTEPEISVNADAKI